MKLKLPFIFFFCIISNAIFAQSYFEKGMSFYNKRAENASKNIAPVENINNALSNFKKSFGTPYEEKAIEYYLQSIYFKAMYCYPEGSKLRKPILEEGKNIGKQMVEKHPNSAPIRYWNAVLIGSWAKESSVITAAKEGVIDKLKKECEKVIELDKSYDDGAGYRFLAILNLDAPYIPFFLTWPDDEEAITLFEKSLKYNPNHISGQYYYAKALNETGNKPKAITVLKKAIQQKPSQSRYLEELSELELCKSLLADLTK